MDCQHTIELTMKRITVPIALFLFCVFANGQQAFRNNGNLQIHPGTSVTGFGDFTNASSAALINNGSLYIRGNISNDQASMAAGTGTLYLNGSSAQSINGTQKYNSYNLVTNNSAGITLNNNLSVSNTHTFSAGIITTSATPNYLIYEAGSSYSGDGDARHVNGWVKKSGNTNFVFPVGNGTVERTVALNSLSASSEFNVKYLPTTPNPNSMVAPVWDVDEPEYWTINKVSGGTATVTLNWDYSKVYFPNWIVPDILVAGYNGTAWTDNGGAGTASGNANTTGTVTSSAISSFNLFTFGSSSYVLPLTLISFTAYRQDGFTNVEWITDKENNINRFIVERSDDGRYFYVIGQLPARNSGTKEQYNTRDNAPINKIAYYRLRTINADGKETFSRIVTVFDKDKNGQLQLLSNPVFYRQVVLTASRQLNGLFNYTMTSVNGQIAQQGKLLIQNGGVYSIELTKNITPGAYMLNVSNGLENFKYKLVVQ